MNREFSFSDVIARAKECFGCKTDKGLAEILGVSPQVMGNRKKIGSIPYEEIIAASMRAGADVQYILTGIRSGNAPGAVVLDREETILVDHYRHIADKEDKTAVMKMAMRSAEAATLGKEEPGRKKRA